MTFFTYSNKLKHLPTLIASLKIALLHFLGIRAGNDIEEWVVSRIHIFYLKENKNDNVIRIKVQGSFSRTWFEYIIVWITQHSGRLYDW